MVVLMYSKNWTYIKGFWLVNTTYLTTARYISMNTDFINCSLVRLSFVLLRLDGSWSWDWSNIIHLSYSNSVERVMVICIELSFYSLITCWRIYWCSCFTYCTEYSMFSSPSDVKIVYLRMSTIKSLEFLKFWLSSSKESWWCSCSNGVNADSKTLRSWD